MAQITHPSSSARGTVVRMRPGWLAVRSMSWKLVTATLLVTILVMGLAAGVMAWQSRQSATANVEREMQAALANADESLQLVFTTASQSAASLMPVFVKTLGGEPKLDGTTVATGAASAAPRLVAGGQTINANDAALQHVHDFTNADPAVMLKTEGAWMRAATLLRDAKGQPIFGTKLAPNDIMSRALDTGKPAEGLIDRFGKWYAMSTKPLLDEHGNIYAGLTMRVDVNDQVQRLLAWVNKARVADFGTLAVLRPSNDGKAWSYLAGDGMKPGESLDKVVLPEVRALITGSESGSAEVDMRGDGHTDFIAWRRIPHWNWLMVAHGKSADFLAASNKVIHIQLAMLLVGAVLIAGLVGWLAASTLRPMRGVINSMMRLGQGDLSEPLPAVPSTSRNEIHRLFDNLRRTQENLAKVVHAVRSGVDEINVGAREIAAGNIDLSSRTEQQAASLEETAASMQEFASTVKHNAENAQQANQLANTASGVTTRGGAAVATVVDTMSAISASSHKIADIVSVIEGIAFQTNILALNAAVEAARAGEQGKGFAVVAGEVRTLAQRSAQAAKEIKQLIQDSVNKVEAGATQVQHAGATMQEILTSIRRVTDIMSEISGASKEQSQGIQQMSQAISQMDETTQQNAALVEEAAAAAGSLESQANRLAQAVSVFKLDTRTLTVLENGVDAAREPALALAHGAAV
ncbi:methyl-accepting chemotaxis protein [Bordetella sp. FB-8]|uniref:methyl-accepting chemotaxis protein n=1 Tax=Bordetella sp. FB-8 TaxID=1159870 RepID=UPI00036CE4B7|nr:methyl-accepting chemotaxis protein [Bordetella sp. FB-8]